MTKHSSYTQSELPKQKSSNCYVAKVGGIKRAKNINAHDHENAAKQYLAQIAREDMSDTKYEPHVRRDGVNDEGVQWWMGELKRRARDGNGWITHEYIVQFTTRQHQ